MEASEAWLQDRDVPKLNLMVRTVNAKPQASYDALGMRSTKCLRGQTRLS
jgi:hypothetical protein